MGALTQNMSYLSQRFLDQDVARAFLLGDVAQAAEDAEILATSKVGAYTRPRFGST
jgi:hypothetical protein